MMMKSVILLAIVAAASAARFSNHADAALENDIESCIIGKVCGEDVDCPCADQNIICNYLSVCKERSIWDIIIRTKPCFRIYKKYCESDSDCECGGKLVCEENECVERKRLGLIARRY